MGTCHLVVQDQPEKQRRLLFSVSIVELLPNANNTSISSEISSHFHRQDQVGTELSVQ